MTRLSAMSYVKTLAPETKNRGRAADLTSPRGAAARSMRSMGAHIRYQTAEPLDRQLTPGLTREHHEHDPLQLLGVGLVGFQRQHALDHDLALLRRDDTRALQRQQQPAALRRQAQQLTVGKNPHAARRGAVARRHRQRWPLLSAGELGEPVERPLDVGAPEARPFQI